MQILKFILLAVPFLFMSFGCSDDLDMPTTPKVITPKVSVSKVNTLMLKLERGEFESSLQVLPASGWLMVCADGEKRQRSYLQYNAQKLIAIGPKACDDLLPWVENKKIEIRYIAIYSIEQIIGMDVRCPYFATFDEVKEQNYKQKIRNYIDVFRDIE